ncbi:tetratricopeptide repeat protein [candidate division KSB1 bacterium]|nr:tetratricopeptide repeat protein [candidate division KSB1 bacterium]
MKKSIYFLLVIITATITITGCGTTKKFLIRDFEKPAKSYDRRAMNHIIRGAMADLVGDSEEALFEYHQAAELDTASPGIYVSLSENYYILNNPDLAIRMARKALRIDKTNLEALELLAASFEKKDDYINAMTIYEKIIQIKPNDIEYLYNLTSLQIINHRYKDAIKTYESLVNNGLRDFDFRMRIGLLFLQSRAFSQAEWIYKNILEDFPNEQTVYLALATTAKAQGDTTGALDWYKTGLLVNPRFKEIRSEMRMIVEEKKMWPEAISFYEKLVQKDTTNLGNKIQLGHFYLQNQDSLAAINHFLKMVDQHPLSERSYLALAAVQKVIKDTASVIETYKKALDQKSTFSVIRSRLRDIYVEKQNWQQALDLYSPLLGTDTTVVSGTIEIANINLQQGDTLRAIERCENLMPDHGDDWRLPVTLGRLYFMTGENLKALPLLKKARDLRNSIPHLWVLVGLAYIQLDSLDSAIDNFKAALVKFPDNPELYYYLGTTLVRQKKHSEAIEYFEQAVKLEPDNLQSILALAGAYDEILLHQKSEPLYKKLIKLNPNSPIILNNYAYHLSVRGVRLDEALEMVTRALEADPDNSPYLDTAGWIYFQKGLYDEAKTYIEKSLKLRSDSPEVLEHLGDVYDKMGEPDMAQLYWKKSLELDGARTHLLEKLDGTSR